MSLSSYLLPKRDAGDAKSGKTKMTSAQAEAFQKSRRNFLWKLGIGAAVGGAAIAFGVPALLKESFSDHIENIKAYLSSNSLDFKQQILLDDPVLSRLLENAAQSLAQKCDISDTGQVRYFLRNSLACSKAYPDLASLPDAYFQISSNAAEVERQLGKAGFTMLGIEDARLQITKNRLSDDISQSLSKDVIYFNDYHYSPQIPLEIEALLPQLKQAGFSIIATEFPMESNPIDFCKSILEQLKYALSIFEENKSNGTLSPVQSAFYDQMVLASKINIAKFENELKLYNTALSMGFSIASVDASMNTYSQQDLDDTRRRDIIMGANIAKLVESDGAKAVVFVGGMHLRKGSGIPAVVEYATGKTGHVYFLSNEFEFGQRRFVEMPQTIYLAAIKQLGIEREKFIVDMRDSPVAFDFLYHLPQTVKEFAEIDVVVGQMKALEEGRSTAFEFRFWDDYLKPASLG